MMTEWRKISDSLSASSLQVQLLEVSGRSNMDGQEFKVRGRQMVDYIIQYLEVQGQYNLSGTLPQSNRKRDHQVLL